MPTVTRIIGKGFKGLEFDQPLGRLNLFLGANGAGKSARTQALTLSVQGYIPGIGKQPGEILNAFGAGEKFFVGLELSDRTHLLRRWARDNKGAAGLQHLVDRKNAPRDRYVQALTGVKVLDLSAFMELSDRKKIDEIFSLFPPAGDIAGMETKIEDLKEKQNTIAADMRALETTRERLTRARSAIQLPSGTMAETIAQLIEAEKQLMEARQALQDARIEEARIAEQEEAARKAEADRAQVKAEVTAEVQSEIWAQQQEDHQAQYDDAVFDPVPTDGPSIIESLPVSSFKPVPTPQIDPFARTAMTVSPITDTSPIITGTGQLIPYTCSEEVETSIRAILDTMNKTGCSACAAALVCKRELRKYQKGAAA